MTFSKIDFSRIMKNLSLIFLFVLLAFISTYPAFVEHYFKMTMDGQIHFARFESVAQALKSGKLPPSINFIGLGNVGEAFSSTYPWLTALLFIIPRSIMRSPVHAMFVGFFAVNLITIINAYFLTKCLTSKKSLQIFGVAIYQLNTYHFIDLYARNAMGESLAYAFIPLVFLGCYQIWNGHRTGILPLALGMGLIFNSHMITSFFAVIILVTIELYRIVIKKFSLRELSSFCLSALLCLPVVLFSLVNLAKITATNKISTTWRALYSIYAWDALQSSVNNVISDKPNQYNVGIVCLSLLVTMIIMSFKKDLQKYAPYIIGATIILVVTLNWITPPKWLVKSIIGNLQFTGRLLPFVIILTVMWSVLILNYLHPTINSNAITVLALCLMTILSFNGIVSYHNTKNDDPVRFYIDNNQTYLSTISEVKCGYEDYTILDNHKKSILKSVLCEDKDFEIKNVRYNRISIVPKTKKKKVGVPFLLYSSVPYKVSVNGKPIDAKQGSTLKLNLSKRKNTIVIQSDAPKINYLTFSVSVISIILLTAAMLFYNRKPQCYQ